MIQLNNKSIVSNQLSKNEIGAATKKLSELARKYLDNNNIKIPIITNSHSIFRLTNLIFYKFLPSIYPNITIREINGISRIVVAFLNDNSIEFNTLQILLSDPNIQLILRNALLNETNENSPITLDYSNSVLINYTPLSIANLLFLNPLNENKNIIKSLKNKSGIYC